MTYAQWRDRLATANDPALYPIDHQDWLVTSGVGQFWATETAALITELASYPSGALVCKAYAGAGDLSALLDDLKPAIEAWARENGCQACMIEGRDGWRRVHPDYRHHQTILVKDL
jgi:hypothetical protein